MIKYKVKFGKGSETVSKQDMIAQDLAEKIHHQQYCPGDFLPSENQLTKLYGTSRETVRNALTQLTDLGLIQKIKGKGSVVLDYQKFTFPVSGITSFKELNQKLKMNAATTVLNYQKNVTIPSYFINHGIKQQDNFYVERLRSINHEALVVDRDYLLNPPIKELPQSAAQNSLYDYIENQLGLEISYATKEITVEKVDNAIADLLHLTGDCLVVIVRSMSFLADTSLFQLTESYHRPDKFKFSDFARRQKIKFN